MANLDQTFNLKQHSDKHKVGCYLMVLFMVSHLSIGGLLMFNLGYWGIAIWVAIVLSGFYLYNRIYTSKCIVQTTAEEFSIEVTTKSAEIDIAVRQFKWSDLVKFSYYSHRSTQTLTLTVSNQEKIVFDSFTAEKFYDYMEYAYEKIYTSDCIVETNAAGFSIEVLTRSLKIGIGKQEFIWGNLICFARFRTKNSEYLVLYLPNDDYVEFSGSTSKAFYTYLKTNFKEKERSDYY